jgi:hypothetical protein
VNQPSSFPLNITGYRRLPWPMRPG